LAVIIPQNPKNTQYDSKKDYRINRTC
jgi:hypothetical protein